MRELLVVIDYQNDFVTGALGNPAAATPEGHARALALLAGMGYEIV